MRSGSLVFAFVIALPACDGIDASEASTRSDAGMNDSVPPACRDLRACCSTLSVASQPLCNVVLGAGSESACSTELSQIQAEGDCGDASTVPGAIAPGPGCAVDASTTDDAAPEATDDGAAACASPVVVPIGGSLSGSTCGGAQLSNYDPCQSAGHPVYYFTVDAPVGAAFSIKSTAPVAIQAFESCGGTSPNCSFNSMSFTLAPNDSTLRLFALERFDVTCGDFSITVVGQTEDAAGP